MFFVVFEPDLSNNCCINTLDICGVVHNFELTNTELNADIELIDTPKGRIVQQLINNNHAYYGYTIGTGKIYSMNTVIEYNLEAIGIAFI